MKKLVYICIVAIAAIFYNCEDAPSLTVPPADYVSFETDEATALVALDGTGEITVNVYATRVQGSDLVLGLQVSEASSASAASYSIPSSITIPSGSNEAAFTVSLIDEEISNAGESLILNMVNDADNGTLVGEPIEISLVRDCPSELEGDWVYTDGNQKSVTIVKTGSTTYTVSGDNTFGTDYAFNISDTCNEITVTGGEIADSFGLAVSGNGTYDSATGELIIFYTVENNLDNREMTLVRQ